MFVVAPRTAKKWADCYRSEGAAGMIDRSSRPHSCPSKTPPQVMRRIVRLRWRYRVGPVQIAGRLGMQASTVHAVLVRCRINRLCHIDRVTGEPLRRYEHLYPGSLIHVDVTKFGNVPDGGGWRYVGKQQGDRNKATTALRTGRTAKGNPRIGTAFVHAVIDDHSRVAYAETCTDEKASTAIAVLRRAIAWFNDHGVTVERVLSDNGSAYKSNAWRDACAEVEINTSEPVPTGHRPAEGSSAFTAPCPTVGTTPGSTNQHNNATPHCPAGSTSKITTEPTPPSEASTSHPIDQRPWTSHLADHTTEMVTGFTGDRLRRLASTGGYWL